jgi:hypothetical protein
MDVIVINKKTGVQKTVPQKVYENLKHLYKLVGEAEPVVEEVKKKESESVPLVDAEPSVVIENGVETQIQLDNSEAVSGDVAEYEALTGKKPDGRWSPAKLAEKIKELKTTQNEA